MSGSLITDSVHRADIIGPSKLIVDISSPPGPGVCFGDPGDQGQVDDGRDHEPPGRDHQGGRRGHRQPGERLLQPIILYLY